MSGHNSDSSEEFEVEAIYGYSRTRKEVAVKWKGSRLRKDEWQPLPQVEMGCSELLAHFKKICGVDADVELEDTDSIAPDHQGWQKYRLGEDEDEAEESDYAPRRDESDDSDDAYKGESSDDSEDVVLPGHKRKRKRKPLPSTKSTRKPRPKIHRVLDPISLQESRRARAAAAPKAKPLDDYTIGIPKPPAETRGRDEELSPNDDAFILGTVFNWFMQIGPIGGLNRFAYLEHVAGLPKLSEKRKAGEQVRTGIQATMHRLVDHAMQRGSLQPPTAVKRMTSEQTAVMIAAIYELFQGKVSGCSHSPDWVSMAKARNLSLDRNKEGAKIGNERLRQRASHLFTKMKAELRKFG